MSDEFGLMRMESRELVPMPRAIPLKNASIEALLEFDAAADLGPTYPHTRKALRHTFADVDDETVVLAGTAAFRIAHPARLTAQEVDRWRETFADYQLISAFDQLRWASPELTAEDLLRVSPGGHQQIRLLLRHRRVL